MHARELVELAALVSAHGPVLIRNGERIATDCIEQYWTTSKVRLDRWAWRLRTFAQQANTDPKRRHAEWPTVRGVLEEILTGEVLTRVWTAVLCAHDRQGGFDDAEPVARSVMIGHMEARHRVLTLMVRGPGIEAEAAVKLNRLRRRAERWTDLLIGHLLTEGDVSEFAADPQRAKDFAQDIHDRGRRPDGQLVWPLIRSSLRAAFQRGLGPETANGDLNARIAASILACFPAEVFDSTGLIRSLWLMRVSSLAEDTQVIVDELLTDTPPFAGKPSSTSRESTGRLRRFGG